MKPKARDYSTGPVDKSKCIHTPGANNSDYTKNIDFRTKMMKTHRPTQCPECGLWCNWVKK